MRRIGILLILLGTFLTKASAQLLQEPHTKALVLKGLHAMYNFEFQESQAHYQELKNQHPQHPASYLLMAMNLEWQYFPLRDFPKQGQQYLNLLDKTLELAEKAHQRNAKDLEAAFFCSASLGFLAAYEADANQYFKAVAHAKKAYSYLKIGIQNSQLQPEFLYPTGIYHYYREAYPQRHPVIQPFMVFFMPGNKALGLKELEQAQKKALFTGIEAAFYLNYIYNKYEEKPSAGLERSAMLQSKFPRNPFFLLQRVELLVLSQQVEEALEYLPFLERNPSPYLKNAYWVLRGLVAEQQKNEALAEQCFKKSLTYPYEERFTKEMRGMAYLGLARIKSQEKLKKQWLHEAKDLLEYQKNIKDWKRLSLR